MASKALITTVIELIVAFLQNPDRPATLSLPVNDLTTFGRSKSSVTYTRNRVRAFTKAVLVERQTPHLIEMKVKVDGVWLPSGETYQQQGLQSLLGVNIKSLKDLGLGSLLSMRTVKPSGAAVSKYYTTIRRMVKGGIMASAIAAQSEPTASKPKGLLHVRHEKQLAAAAKPKAVIKPKPTGNKTVTFGGLSVVIPAADFAATKSAWSARAKAVGCKSVAPTKAELVVRTVTYEALFC